MLCTNLYGDTDIAAMTTAIWWVFKEIDGIKKECIEVLDKANNVDFNGRKNLHLAKTLVIGAALFDIIKKYLSYLKMLKEHLLLFIVLRESIRENCLIV